MSTDLNLKPFLLKKAELILRALNHDLRQELLAIIHKQGEANVSEMYTQLNLEQTLVSQHLSILRKAGFLKSRREGKLVFYTINYDRLKMVQDYIKTLNG